MKSMRVQEAMFEVMLPVIRGRIADSVHKSVCARVRDEIEYPVLFHVHVQMAGLIRDQVRKEIK